MEKNWRTIIQRDKLVVEESRHYNVSVLINHRQDFKNDDTLSW